MPVGRGVFLDVREEGVDALAQLRGRGELGTHRGQALDVLRPDSHDLDVELSLAREVVVEEAFRDPGGGGDLVDRDRVVWACVEETTSEVEKLAPPFVHRETSTRARPHGRAH